MSGRESGGSGILAYGALESVGKRRQLAGRPSAKIRSTLWAERRRRGKNVRGSLGDLAHPALEASSERPRTITPVASRSRSSPQNSGRVDELDQHEIRASSRAPAVRRARSAGRSPRRDGETRSLAVGPGTGARWRSRKPCDASSSRAARGHHGKAEVVNAGRVARNFARASLGRGSKS